MDADIVAAARELPEEQRWAFVAHLKSIWARREIDYMEKGVRFNCDCLMYQDGDYAKAMELTRDGQ
jgi:hypothetical protein